MSHTNKRGFLKFAGMLSVVSIAEKLFMPRAQAQTWQKIANPTGAAGTWQKLTIATTTNVIGMTGGAGCGFHSLALRSDGMVYSCGSNSFGQLGINTAVGKSTFVQAIGISNAIAVAACGDAYGTSVVLRSDGKVYASGYDGYGVLGDGGGTINRSTFVQAIGISNAIAVAGGCGYDPHALALRSDGMVYSCGANSLGQLGDGTTTSRATYVQAVGISNAIAIADGGSHSMALRSDGMVFAVGYNNSGQLGDNTTVSKSTFVQAIGISNAIAIACGYEHSIALRSDGVVYSCGYNTSGRLGDGTTTNRSTFVQAVGISNAITIAGGKYHSLALRSDGIIYSCGENSSGQLINNTTTSKSTFIQTIGG